MGGGLQLPTIQRDSELLKKLPSWTRSTSLHTHTHTRTHSRFDCLSLHTSAIQTHLRAQTIMSGLGWGVGWGGLQLPTIQRDSEVLKKLPSWTRSTSLHTHARTHVLIAFHYFCHTNSVVGWGVGWGGLQLPTIQRDSEVLKKLPRWTRSTSLHTHARTHVLIAFHFILLPYKLTCARKL